MTPPVVLRPGATSAVDPRTPPGLANRDRPLVLAAMHGRVTLAIVDAFACHGPIRDTIITWELNTWAGVGAPPQPQDAIGLRYFTMQLPESDEVGEIVDRVRGNGGAIEEKAEGVLLRDPSQNGVMLTVQPPEPPGG